MIICSFYVSVQVLNRCFVFVCVGIKDENAIVVPVTCAATKLPGAGAGAAWCRSVVPVTCAARKSSSVNTLGSTSQIPVHRNPLIAFSTDADQIYAFPNNSAT